MKAKLPLLPKEYLYLYQLSTPDLCEEFTAFNRKLTLVEKTTKDNLRTYFSLEQKTLFLEELLQALQQINHSLYMHTSTNSSALEQKLLLKALQEIYILRYESELSPGFDCKCFASVAASIAIFVFMYCYF